MPETLGFIACRAETIWGSNSIAPNELVYPWVRTMIIK